jgi:hypothetical protein
MSDEIIININPSVSDNIVVDTTTPAPDNIQINSFLSNDNIVVDTTTPAPDNIQINSFLSNVASVNGKTGVVFLDKNDIGLDQVDNTSDLNKPLSYSTLNYTQQYFLPLSGGTVVGNISSNDTFFAKSGNSNNWNSAYTVATIYQSASGSFATNTLLQSTSALLTPLTITNTLTGTIINYSHTNFLPLTGGTLTGNIYTKALSANGTISETGLLSAVVAVFNGSVVEGIGGEATGLYSHVEGAYNKATASFAHAEGGSITDPLSRNTASGTSSHAEGRGTVASGLASHAEGVSTQAVGIASHAEGVSTQALGLASHAEGLSSIAVGDYSHAAGQNTYATGIRAYTTGQNTSATRVTSYAHGRFALANNARSWIWQGTGTENLVFTSTRNDQFAIRPEGGFYVSGNVGINTDRNDNALSVVGHISASGNVTSNNSINWDTAYNRTTNVSTVSSNWDSVYSNVNSNSANNQSVYSNVNSNSANWSSVYSNVNSNSANNQSVYSNVNSNSANWSSVYSNVNSASANWQSAANLLTTVPITTSFYVPSYSLTQTTGTPSNLRVFTVPAGRRFIAKMLLGVTATATLTGVATAPTLRLVNVTQGNTGMIGSWTPATATLVTSPVPGAHTTTNANSIIAQAGEDVALRLITAAGGFSVLTVDVVVDGFLI